MGCNREALRVAKIEILFPDGSKHTYESGVTTEEIAGSISPGLKKKGIAGKLNGQLIDYRRPIHESGELTIIMPDSKDGLDILRHSTAHLMAQATQRVFQDENIQFGVGPIIENGFYYDIDMEYRLTEEDLPKIEKEMKKIVGENLAITREEVTRDEAIRRYKEKGDALKVELIEAIPEGQPITFYHQGEFFDLCRGVHVPQTSKLKVFKLMNISGAYWRGDSNNQMLQRIYGTAFDQKSELDEHIHFIEEAKARDHRKLGKELELFMFSEEAPGMPFYLPNGQFIRNELESFSRSLQMKNQYDEVRTPLMMNQRLWEKSGHWDHYKDNMYFSEVDNTKFALKPMNCPGHMLIYKDTLKSYRDLPIRMAEFGQVHRHEYSGALNGMIRVRTFCQDDAHIFVTPEQIEGEIKSVFALIDQIYSTFGFEYSVELSTRPEDSMGSDVLWDQAEGALKNVLLDLGIDYSLNEGDGAFYGPKIDFHIRDALRRSHQCATIQLDFQMPDKFDLTYVDENNDKVRPVVIHRAVFGSIDRFLGILVEHFAGAFPTWIAPVQVKVLPVSKVHEAYAKDLYKKLLDQQIRVELDNREEKLGYKMRHAQMSKIPYTIVVGDNEVENQTVNVRKYKETHSQIHNFDDFLSLILQDIETKKIEKHRSVNHV
ncbi:threonine--tRNA ligase [Pseudalkalibacillus berkeleyi]|uniref:Threonine--tRNA ligase n=1 Tax=Pseudalkalibacillus berkeleyi TaxID=1069813 RepID=A0ABS9H2U8_9BACL|nr:threonine--tRNA ligase [Pseudalkalibacillus berkeleyi]MCF6138183.1 threonine--tRNA ligase [Pseudalkalibacillus berkeleyi]